MHPSYLRLQKGRADALALLGAADESRKVALDLYRIAEVYYGDVSSPMRGALITLAFADSYLGDYVEATRALCRAGQICECIREPIDEAYLYLADAFLVLRACERADACLDLVHARFADSKEPNQFMSVRMLALECRSILEQGQPDQALKMAEEYASALGNQASYLMGFNVTEALARIELGQLEDAERVLKSTQEISAVEGNAFPFQPRHQEAYALLLWKKGKYDDAAAMCEQALEMSRQQYGTDHPLQVRTLRVYADALRESGHKEESDRALARCRAIEQRIEKMRQTILDDPECELPVVNVESNVELPTN